jgi:adenylate kinase
MGVAGSGKSMQGEILAKKLGYQWLSSGHLLREYVTGKKKEDMLKGKLLDDQELIGIISKALSEADQKHMILDGFPRTLVQANWLLKRHEEGKISLDKVVLLEVSKETVLKRLLQRGRQDDNEETINKRFEEYEKLTLPIIDLYTSHGIDVCRIDGGQSIEEVSRSIAVLFDKE